MSRTFSPPLTNGTVQYLEIALQWFLYRTVPQKRQLALLAAMRPCLYKRLVRCSVPIRMMWQKWLLKQYLYSSTVKYQLYISILHINVDYTYAYSYISIFIIIQNKHILRDIFIINSYIYIFIWNMFISDILISWNELHKFIKISITEIFNYIYYQEFFYSNIQQIHLLTSFLCNAGGIIIRISKTTPFNNCANLNKTKLLHRIDCVLTLNKQNAKNKQEIIKKT